MKLQILLALLALAIIAPLRSPCAVSDDNAELTALVERFFETFAKEDLDGFMTLWSETSPDFAATRLTMPQLWAAADYRYAIVSVTRLKVEGSRATLRVVIDLTSKGRESQKERTEREIRTMSFSREGEVWKVWRSYPASEDLAVSYMAAASEDRRRALLDAEPELKPALKEALHSLGHKLERQGGLTEAEKAWKEYLALAESASEPRAIAEALRDLGTVFRRRGDYAGAFANYKKSLALWESVNDRDGAGATLNSMGVAYRLRGDYGLALDCYQKALAINETLKDNRGIAIALNNIGIIHRLQGDYEKALEMYGKSLAIREALKDSSGIAESLNNLGIVHRLQADYPGALELYERALSIHQSLNNRAGVAAVLNNIGIIQEAHGHFREALESYEKSLAIEEASGNRAGIAGSLHNMSVMYRGAGDYGRAMELAEKGLAIREALGDQAGIAASQQLIGGLERLTGRHAQAVERFKSCLTIREALGDRPGIAATQNEIGSIYFLQEDYQKALDCYMKSLSLIEGVGDRAGVAAIQKNLADLYRQQGQLAQALDLCQKSLATRQLLGDQAGIVASWVSMAAVYELQAEYHRSKECCESGLAIAESIGSSPLAFRLYSGMGRAEVALGKRDEAIRAFRTAIEHLERMQTTLPGGEEERLAYLHEQGKDNVYASLVNLLVEQNALPEALSYLERARSKQLLDGIRLRSLAVRDDSLRQLLGSAEDLERALGVQERSRLQEVSAPPRRRNEARIANLTQHVAHTRAELLQVTERIKEANPDYERFVAVRTTDLRRFQNRLPTNVVVVQYVPLESALLVLLVKSDATQAQSVAVSRHRLEEVVQSVRGEMDRASRNPIAYRKWDWQSDRARPLREALSTLYGYLVAPIRNHLTSAQTVIIIPNGALHYLPFGALIRGGPSEDTAGAQGGGLRFFSEEKQISLITSLGLWEQIADEQAAASPRSLARGRLAAFGDPDGTLPSAELEVRQVGSLFPGSLVYSGAEATRERVETLPNDVTLAHFAVHGNLSVPDINDCYLALANKQRLKLGDLYGLAGRYPARMTVLSACETAVGRSNPGNEVSHLAHGFVEAGSTTIVASLWKVADDSSSLWMTRFYEELKAGQPVAEAKRQAEIVMLKQKETAHPYFWAPFILIGDWR